MAADRITRWEWRLFVAGYLGYLLVIAAGIGTILGWF